MARLDSGLSAMDLELASAALWAVIVIAALAKLAQHFPDWMGLRRKCSTRATGSGLALVWAA